MRYASSFPANSLALGLAPLRVLVRVRVRFCSMTGVLGLLGGLSARRLRDDGLDTDATDTLVREYLAEHKDNIRPV